MAKRALGAVPWREHWTEGGGAGGKQPTEPQCVVGVGWAGPADELTVEGQRNRTKKNVHPNTFIKM